MMNWWRWAWWWISIHVLRRRDPRAANRRVQGPAPTLDRSGLGPLGSGSSAGGDASVNPPAVVRHTEADVMQMHRNLLHAVAGGMSVADARRAVYPKELLEHPCTQMTEIQVHAAVADMLQLGKAGPAEVARDQAALDAVHAQHPAKLEAELHPDDARLYRYFKAREDAGIDTMAGQRIGGTSAHRPTKELTPEQEAAAAKATDEYFKSMADDQAKADAEEQARAARDKDRLKGTSIDRIIEERGEQCEQ